MKELGTKSIKQMQLKRKDLEVKQDFVVKEDLEVRKCLPRV